MKTEQNSSCEGITRASHSLDLVGGHTYRWLPQIVAGAGSQHTVRRVEEHPFPHPGIERSSRRRAQDLWVVARVVQQRDAGEARRFKVVRKK